MNVNLKERLALREMDDNITWMRIIFQQYLSWYTFFITANLFVLSWVFTKEIQEGLFPLALLFVLLNICGTGVAVLLGQYIARAEKRNRFLVEQLNAIAELQGDQAMHPTFPASLARVGFVFIALGLVGIATLWLVAALL